MLTGLIIPQTACLADVMETKTAQRLVDRGASLYLMADGTTSVLSIKRPEGAFAKAWGLADKGEGLSCAA